MTVQVSKKTWLVLAAALVVAGVATALAPSEHAEDSGGLEVAKHVKPTTHAKAPQELVTVGELDERLGQLDRRTEADTDVINLFEAVSNKPAPPPPPPPPKPVAPAFPYTMIGSMQEAGQATVYLSGPTRILTARTDQIIDGVYHVDEANASHLTVTYMPLHQKQVINFGTSE